MQEEERKTFRKRPNKKCFIDYRNCKKKKNISLLILLRKIEKKNIAVKFIWKKLRRGKNKTKNMIDRHSERKKYRFVNWKVFKQSNVLYSLVINKIYLVRWGRKLCHYLARRKINLREKSGCSAMQFHEREKIIGRKIGS